MDGPFFLPLPKKQIIPWKEGKQHVKNGTRSESESGLRVRGGIGDRIRMKNCIAMSRALVRNLAYLTFSHRRKGMKLSISGQKHGSACFIDG